MSHMTIAQQMRGVEIKPGTRRKRVANNTVRYVAPNGDIVYRLHMTDIVRIGHDDAGRQVVTLRMGGWNTFDRINRFAPMNWRVSSWRGEPIIGCQPFEDGMQIIDGNLPPCHDNPWLHREIEALIRQCVDAAEAQEFNGIHVHPALTPHPTLQEALWNNRYHLQTEGCQPFISLTLAQAAIPKELSTRWRAIQRLGGQSPALRAKLRKRVRKALVRLFDGFQP